jgi:hypothetical protein
MPDEPSPGTAVADPPSGETEPPVVEEQPESITEPAVDQPAADDVSGAVTEPAAESDPAEDKADEWPDELVDRAKGYGIEDPHALGTVEQLENFLAHSDAKVAEITIQAMKPPGEEPPEPAEGKPTEKAKPEAQPSPPDTPAPTGFNLNLSDEQQENLGTEIISSFTDMTNHYNKAMVTMSQQMDQMRGAVAGMQQAAAVQFFDGELRKLDSEWDEFIGRGASLELDQKGDHFQRRFKIDQTALALAQAEGPTPGGQPRRVTAAHIKRAAYAVAATNGFNPKAKQLAAAVQRRAKSAVSRPSETKVADPDNRGVPAQLRAVDEMLRKQGKL